MAARKKAARVLSSGSKIPPKKAGTKKRVSKKASKKPEGKTSVPAAAKRPPRKATSKAATRRRRVVATEPAAPSFPEIAALAELMQAHGLLEVDYETAPDGSTRLHIMRSDAGFSASVPAVAPAAGAAQAEPVVEVPSATPEPADAGLVAFKSPMVGTFFRAPSPEATAFANVGDVVDTASVVCIIEAMKVMNEITPDFGGEIVSIEVENGGAVEFGQTLMLIRPR